MMAELRALIDQPTGAELLLTGVAPATEDQTVQAEKELIQAETVSFPFALLILILVFSSIVAAGMPLVVAALAIPTALAGVYLVAQITELSIYVQNVATMLGLALAIDYSLFMVSRFREELRKGRDVAHRRRDHRRDQRQGRRVLRARRRDRPVGAAAVRADRAAVVRDRRLDRRRRLGLLRADVPAGRPGHARAPGQLARRGRAPRPDPAGDRPADRRRRRHRDRDTLGADGPLGHGPPLRLPDPDPRLPAARRHAVPAPRAGHPRRIDPAAAASRAARPPSRCPRSSRPARPRRSSILATVDGSPTNAANVSGSWTTRRARGPRRRRQGRGSVRRPQGPGDRRRARRRGHRRAVRRPARPAPAGAGGRPRDASRTPTSATRPSASPRSARTRRSARPASMSCPEVRAVAVDGVTTEVGGLAAQGARLHGQPVRHDPVRGRHGPSAPAR